MKNERCGGETSTVFHLIHAYETHSASRYILHTENYLVRYPLLVLCIHLFQAVGYKGSHVHTVLVTLCK